MPRYNNHRHVTTQRCTGAQVATNWFAQQLTRRDQITLTALQGRQQLILGLGDDFQTQGAAIGCGPVQVLLERAQALVLDTDTLASDLA